MATKKINKAPLPSTFVKKEKELDGRWLVQPTVITFMRYDYNLLQGKIFVRIIESLQQAIQETIHNYNNHISTQLSLFTDEQFKSVDNDFDKISLKLALNSFGISRLQYKALKDALKALVTIPVEIPFKDKEGKKWRYLTNLCSAYFPDEKRVSYVYINIEKRTALRLLALDFGFTKFFKNVVLNSKSVYTQRLYIYLSAFVKDGGVKWKMDELRKYLCLKGEYSNFCDFNKRILKPVQAELKKMFDKGISNFFFEYDKLYLPNRIRFGTPDLLVFKIISRDELMSRKEELEVKRKQIYDLLLSNQILMEKKYAVEIVGKITLENHLQVLNKLVELSEILSHPQSNIVHRSKYVYTALLNLIDNTVEDAVILE